MALSLALAAKCKAFFVRSLSVGAVAFGLFALTHCSSSKQSCDGLPPSTTATIDGESACFLASMATSTGPLTAPTVPCAAAGCTGNYSYCSLDTATSSASCARTRAANRSKMIDVLTPTVKVMHTARGVVISSTMRMPEPARCVGDWLTRWAEATPNATFLAERDPEGAWKQLNYGQFRDRVNGIASALIERGGRADRPLMILSDNSIDAALLTLAAMQVGIPVSQVSSAYSLASTTFARLGELSHVLGAQFVYADSVARFKGALDAIANRGITIITSDGSEHATVDQLAQTQPSQDAARAKMNVGPDSIAKILFTSGSTGSPKGVVNTQRMLTANQESLFACWPFLKERPPVVVDWLPWSHTFGGNHNFFLVLRNGGSLYIDRGRPIPSLAPVTIKNLADVSPTLWFNVPRGFDQAAPLLENDPDRARDVFRNLDLVFYAAAALSPTTRARLEKVAERAGRPDLFFTSAWGSTETAPLATSAHFTTRTTGILGVPVPGVEIKLAPVEDRFELRVRGPNVTPGFWREGGLVTPLVVDEDGFLPTGDAGRLVDPDRAELGIVFVGRLSENFKLSSGTWVNVAAVRLAVVEACAPLVVDAAIAGHDGDRLSALLFLAAPARDLAPSDLRTRVHSALTSYNADHPGLSERIARVHLSFEPLSLDEGETTDKGYTNQRRVLERRKDDLAQLLADASPNTDACFDIP
jgi:feruloyl-CoA synthase